MRNSSLTNTGGSHDLMGFDLQKSAPELGRYRGFLAVLEMTRDQRIRREGNEREGSPRRLIAHL